MDTKYKELFCILQEECAEVTQAVSKIFRFGIDNQVPDSNKTNRERLEDEIGDLQCMINLLSEFGIVNETNIKLAQDRKRKKLHEWSNIFDKPR